MNRMERDWQLIPYGSYHFNIRLFDEPSPQLTCRLAELAKEIGAFAWVREVVLGFRDMVVYGTSDMRHDLAISLLENALRKVAQSEIGAELIAERQHHIPVRYNGEDLACVAAETGFTESDIITMHTAKSVTVSVLGFRPFFGYCLGVDDRLFLPRKASPSMVQAGAVALAAGMTAIYPDDGPGGWHVIGHCDPGFCKRLAIGDRIQWEAIT